MIRSFDAWTRSGVIAIAVVFAILGFFASPDAAQEAGEPPPAGPEEEKVPKAEGRRQLTVLPVVGYSPETRFMFGGAGVALIGAVAEPRPTVLHAIAVVTTRKQIQLETTSDIYLRQGAYRVLPDIGFARWPDKFYGIGNEARANDAEEYTGQRVFAWIRGLKTVSARFSVGLAVDFTDYLIRKVEPDGRLASGTIPGSTGGIVSGVGGVVAYDSRDRAVWPSSGTYAEATALCYAKPLGSDYSFNAYGIDVRKFIAIGRSPVLAAQAFLNLETGTPPFQELSTLGGTYRMRGFYEGRYRERDMIELQAELRVPLFWRFGAVGFIGYGDVARSPSDFKLASMKTAGGFGLRFAVQRQRRVNLRFDVAWGSGGSSGVYLFAEEAF